MQNAGPMDDKTSLLQAEETTDRSNSVAGASPTISVATPVEACNEYRTVADCDSNLPGIETGADAIMPTDGVADCNTAVADDTPLDAAAQPNPEPAAPHATPFRNAIDAAASEAHLTPQERNVLVLLAQGRNARSIADNMTLSMNTVRSHMRNVYAKLGVHSQQELIDAINDRVDLMRKSQQNHRS